jgi:glycosyltransferase involved in cell wall biosynthesis
MQETVVRIAMVDPYFAIGLGYQPTGWFNALVAQGHQVRAFCSCYTPTVARHLYDHPFPEGLAKVNGGEMLRLRVRLLPRDMVYCPGLLQRVVEYAPELVLATYPGTVFAHPIFKNRRKLQALVVSTYGENSAQRRSRAPGWRLVAKNLLLDASFFLLKRRIYRQDMEASDLVLLQTPDTFEYLLPRVASRRQRERIRGHSVLSPLGFEAGVFHPDTDGRRQERLRLGIADDEVVALYACKIRPEKRLDLWVSLMASALRRVPRLRAILIGFVENDPMCEPVRRWIDATGLRDRFICLPFAARDQLQLLANAADFGVWHLQPAVTIQEVMGTGLYMILTDDSTVSHLVVDPVTGRYFREQDFGAAEDLVVRTATELMAGGPIARMEERRRRAEINTRLFSYEAMAARLVAAANDPANAMAIMRYDRSSVLEQKG